MGDPRKIFSYQCHHNDVSWKGPGTLQARNWKTMKSYCILHINCLFPPLGTWWEPSNRSLTPKRKTQAGVPKGLVVARLQWNPLPWGSWGWIVVMVLVKADVWFPSWGDMGKACFPPSRRQNKHVWCLLWPTCGAWKMVRCACKLNLPKVEMKLEKKLTQPSPNKCLKV